MLNAAKVNVHLGDEASVDEALKRLLSDHERPLQATYRCEQSWAVQRSWDDEAPGTALCALGRRFGVACVAWAASLLR